MAYVGVGLESHNGKIKVKLHGPTDKFNVNTSGLRVDVQEIMNRAHSNLMSLCQDVSQSIIDKYGNGVDIVWAETEIETSNGVLVGASATTELDL